MISYHLPISVYLGTTYNTFMLLKRVVFGVNISLARLNLTVPPHLIKTAKIYSILAVFTPISITRTAMLLSIVLD
jgi:hypothetical protein